ncbi:MAG: ABC transporter ATP-binding protein [Spirochaetales bacterium]|nr:ABC transporter ATP-binding protein [Spirochaetales bacterium]
MAEPILSVNGLSKRFKFDAGFFAPEDKYVYAVNNVSFTINPGEIYGLVGESGCGKTTTARLIVRMYRPDEGSILFTDAGGSRHELEHSEGAALKRAREQIQYVFQDPARSLNPRMTIGEVLLSGYRYASTWPGKTQATEEARVLLSAVGLNPDDMYRRPPDFSGGQRQRISIARALLMKPRLLICDEVVSALDVSIQSQILNLLLKLKDEYHLSMLFISHDLAVITYICDRVGVMYRGTIVEEAPSRTLIENPCHAYTRYLYSSIPRLGGTPAAGQSAVQDSPYRGVRFDPTQKPAQAEFAAVKELGDRHRVLDSLLL